MVPGKTRLSRAYLEDLYDKKDDLFYCTVALQLKLRSPLTRQTKFLEILSYFKVSEGPKVYSHSESEMSPKSLLS